MFSDPEESALKVTKHQPSAAEIARTLLAGIGTAVLTSARAPVTIPVLHAQATNGETVIVAEAESLPDLGVTHSDVGHSVSGVPVLLQIRSLAPVEDLTVTRAITLISGTVTSLPAGRIRAAMDAECSGLRLGEVLGYRAGARLLAFSPNSCELVRGEQFHQIPIDDVLSASPDPLAHSEPALIMTLREETADDWLPLLKAKNAARGLDGRTPVDLSTVREARPIALDAYGVTLACSWYDRAPAAMRIPFPEPVHSGGEALDAVRLLVLAHQLAA
ncbi:hypothetical protein [Spelaeicoccus albus]|uniref:DUF2470 domain-containing protein n=1 Tax=Spelaeicoccus albus TaxID=1280376 RepID=A0A7Z0D4F7_9MICO|nr:hypothetical protein [Spelaeicoccus albus]NYI68626.1 hypothetical protein [Spelaeicoccus albus]